VRAKPTVLVSLLAAAALGPVPGRAQGPASGARPRSEIRIRDPFVLADPATKTYYIYSSTTHGIDSQEPRKEVVVYASRDLETWEAPATVLEVPSGHWGRETVWAPEVHLYKGRYYLFVTLTSKDTLPTPEGRPPNVKRGTEVFVADRPTGPFRALGKGAQTPPDWMALDGTLWVEDGVPYMVFAHEWIQITDGSMDLVRLSDDLSSQVGAPQKLFHASEADWVRCRGDLGELFQGKRYHAYITDGAWLHRTRTDKLVMLWSSYGPRKYATGVAVSASGRVAGPWVQQKELLWEDDGGHPMLFRAFDGRLLMTIHQPNRRVERARFFEMDDSGDTVRLVRELTTGVR
jgi:hypothetical protein